MNTDTTEQPSRPVAPIVQADNIPSALKRLPHWVMWRYYFDGKRWTKPPYQTNGQKASTTDPATWTDFKSVMAALKQRDLNLRSFQFDGIGFVLNADDPFCGVDLDHCIDNGKLTAWAQHVVTTLNSYTEITPSGTGLRIFVRAKLPGGSGRKNGQIEIYDRARFLTITGQMLNHAKH